VANGFGRNLRGFADNPDWRVLVGFSMNSTYSMLFSSSPKEIFNFHAVVFLATRNEDQNTAPRATKLFGPGLADFPFPASFFFAQLIFLGCC